MSKTHDNFVSDSAYAYSVIRRAVGKRAFRVRDFQSPTLHVEPTVRVAMTPNSRFLRVERKRVSVAEQRTATLMSYMCACGAPLFADGIGNCVHDMQDYNLRSALAFVSDFK